MSTVKPEIRGDAIRYDVDKRLSPLDSFRTMRKYPAHMRTLIVHFTDGAVESFQKINRAVMDTTTNELVLVSDHPGYSRNIPREKIRVYFYANELPADQ